MKAIWGFILLSGLFKLWADSLIWRPQTILAFFDLAQRTLCASAIFARPSNGEHTIVRSTCLRTTNYSAILRVGQHIPCLLQARYSRVHLRTDSLAVSIKPLGYCLHVFVTRTSPVWGSCGQYGSQTKAPAPKPNAQCAGWNDGRGFRATFPQR